MPSSLHWFDWLVIAIYMATMIFLGWRAARGSRSLNDYFVGGRNVGGFAAGISLLATLLSTVSYLSYPGETISHGAGFLWQIVALPIVFVIVGYLLIPHIMSFPVTSAYELLETQLGPSIRTLAACLFVLLRLIWMALILHTACTAMSVILGIPRESLMIGIWIVTLIYTTEGGIRAVIWTDIAQFFVLLGGALFAIVFLLIREQAGPAWLVEDAWNSMLHTPLFSFDPGVRTTAVIWIISVGVFWIATCGSDQVAMQRFFTNRDATVARRTLLVNLGASAVMNIALAALGLTLLRYYSTNLDRLPGELQDLKPEHILTDEGPISFGMILSVEVVSWSAPDAKDILISRCWDGVYLYPSKDLKEIGPPIKLCGTLGLPPKGGRMFFLCTADDFPGQPSTVIIGNRHGGLFRLKKVGEYPDLKLEMVGPLNDPETKLPLNIPFTNPNYRVDDASGYLNLDYFNYVFPIFYPGRQHAPPGLIAGDWGGNLWWLPRQDTSGHAPVFAGTPYKKSDGRRFAKPQLATVDENGRPLLLGFAVEKGKRADGGVTRPVYYKDDHTSTDDLLVLCGTGPNELLYLKRVSTASNGAPSFANLGPVSLKGGESDGYDAFAYHSMMAVFPRDGWNQLLISRGQ